MMAEDGDFLRPIVRTVIQEFLEAEMTEAIGAQEGERVEGGSGYRSGYYPRSLITRPGGAETFNAVIVAPQPLAIATAISAPKRE